MNRSERETTTEATVARGMGGLAAEQSSHLINERFDSIEVDFLREARIRPEVTRCTNDILHDELICKKIRSGNSFPDPDAAQSESEAA